MSDQFNGISAFIAAVEAGSFAMAAERMGLTRSAVGKTIARLERRLGVRLFNRTTRSQSLTENGQIYYERCLRALTELDAGSTALDNSKGEPIGRLRVSAPTLFGRHCVAPILAALSRQHPRLSIEMFFNDQVVDLVDEGYDLAVRIDAIPDSSSLIARRLGTQKMVICAAPSYIASHGKPSNPGDLSKHAAIGYGRSGRIEPWLISADAGRILKWQVQSQLVFNDLQAITDAAVAGYGLAWLPCWLMTKHLLSGELEIVIDDDSTLATEIYAVWPQSHYLPAKTRMAIDALVCEVPKMIGQFEYN